MSSVLPILLDGLRGAGWVLLGLWAVFLCGACYYSLRPGLRAWASVALFAGVIVGVLVRFPGLPGALLCVGVCAVVSVLWAVGVRPSNDRDWVPDKSVLAHAEFDGDFVTLRNVRDAAYPAMLVSEPAYLDRTIDLSKVAGLDMFQCHWGSELIAHPMLTWRFEDAEPLVISVETRNTLSRGYSAIAGFFRQYELIYVVCTERDAVLRRTMYEPDDDQVYMYKLRAPPDAARRLLVSYLKRVNALSERPEFYNTLLNNCTNNIRIHVVSTSGRAMPWNWGILVPGWYDQGIYQNGGMASDLPFDELKARGHLNPVADAIGRVDDFSLRIREGVPGFTDEAGASPALES